MFLPIAFLAALGGAGLAAAAALLPDTGVDGTIGAFLALAGAVAATVLLGLFIIYGTPGRRHGAVVAAVVFVEVLTGVAAWFLMQDALLIAMAVSAAALLASAMTAPRRVAL